MTLARKTPKLGLKRLPTSKVIMPQIKTIILRCINPVKQVIFYTDILGMTALGNDTVGYEGEEESQLKFVPAKIPYTPAPNDLYWKIALAVPDIELAYRQLSAKGVEIDYPTQFQDIAYLAHIHDPEGFTIELIEHTFKNQRLVEPSDQTQFGGGAHLNLLTLRTNNAEEMRRSCEALGMKQLAIMPVKSYGFILYFYALTTDNPPDPNPYAIENRTWVYQRPYTVFEIQHIAALDSIRRPEPQEAGYGKTIFFRA